MNYTKNIIIDTADYTLSHGRTPKGKGAWAFFIGCRNDISKLFFAPRSMTYAEARKLAVQEALRKGVDYVSVGA